MLTCAAGQVNQRLSTLADVRPITSDQVDDAISVIAEAVHSVYGRDEATPERIAAVRAKLLASGSLDDMRDLSAHYRDPEGLFLVLLDERRVVGTGALKRLDADTAELGRMWFLPAYRGRGLGRRMAEQLLAFAREHGYRRVRLDTSSKCADAVELFRKLGFKEIDRYKESPTTLFMELRLNGKGG